jgi:hypothetical protein
MNWNDIMDTDESSTDSNPDIPFYSLVVNAERNYKLTKNTSIVLATIMKEVDKFSFLQGKEKKNLVKYVMVECMFNQLTQEYDKEIEILYNILFKGMDFLKKK